MPKGKYRTARNVGFSSERLAPCIYRILAARAYFHGSSPRMWGTHRLQQHADAVLRFIPTHVGNTEVPERIWLFTTVHPHACGEHSCEAAGAQQTHGSSPRMWGTPGWLPPDPPRTRFIPTHVGNTAKTQARHCVPAVHPHACGEHWTSPYRSCRCGGSSPRMWGTPGAGAVGGSPRRFIPTHVGNTGASPAGAGRWSVHPHACGEHTYRTELFLKKKKHLEKSTASSSIPWSDPEAGMPPIAARRTTLDVDG